MSSTSNRRRHITIQDLCHTSSDTSTQHSPTTSTDRYHVSLSTPISNITHNPHQQHSNPSICDYHPNLSAPDSSLHSSSPFQHPRHSSRISHHSNSRRVPLSSDFHHSSRRHETRAKAVRGPWRVEEDRLLIELVRKYGARHWSSIATHFEHRSGKQARERWMNQLNPDLKKKNWTLEEDRYILHGRISYGTKWSVIAKFLDGRTDNSVKNRYNSTLTRAMKEQGIDPDSLMSEQVIEQFLRRLHARPFVFRQEMPTEETQGRPIKREHFMARSTTMARRDGVIRNMGSLHRLSPTHINSNSRMIHPTRSISKR